MPRYDNPGARQPIPLLPAARQEGCAWTARLNRLHLNSLHRNPLQLNRLHLNRPQLNRLHLNRLLLLTAPSTSHRTGG